MTEKAYVLKIVADIAELDAKDLAAVYGYISGIKYARSETPAK